MTQPLVSIIIPTYNRAHLIGETLDSVLAQTYTNWECIVVDDGSNDNTDEVLKGYCDKDARFKYFKRPYQKPKGANACRNYGFELSKGEYIQWLDSDDIITQHCLSTRLSYFRENEIDFVVANTSKFNDDVFEVGSMNIDPNLESNENYTLLFLNYKLPWTIMSVLWKRSVIFEFSFDESLFRFQDVDIHIRILMSKKYKFKRLYNIDNYYRYSGLEKNNHTHEDKVVDSFFKLIDKLGEDMSQNVKYSSAFRRFCYIISRDFIYFSQLKSLKNKKEFDFLMNRYKFFDFKDSLIFLILGLYSIYNLEGKKGYGFYRFRRFCNKYYDQNLISLRS